MTEDVGLIVLCGVGAGGGVGLWSQLIVFRHLCIPWFWCCLWVEATFICAVVVLTALLNPPNHPEAGGAEDHVSWSKATV